MRDDIQRKGYDDATTGQSIQLEYQYIIEYLEGFVEGLYNLRDWDKEVDDEKQK